MLELAPWVATPAPRPVFDHRLPDNLVQDQRVGRRFLFGRQGEECQRVHFIAGGHVSLRKTDRNGEDRLLEILGPGEFFGEEAVQPGGIWRFTAASITPAVVRSLPARQLPRLAQFYPQIVSDLCEQLSARVELTYERMDLVLRAPARERVYGLLTALATRYGQLRDHRVWLSLPLNQAELADLAQVRRETVVRVLGALEAEGLIERRGRRGMWLDGAA